MRLGTPYHYLFRAAGRLPKPSVSLPVIAYPPIPAPPEGQFRRSLDGGGAHGDS